LLYFSLMSLFIGQTHARVADRDEQPTHLAHFRFDRKVTGSVLHGLDGVKHEVHQNLLELHSVGCHLIWILHRSCAIFFAMAKGATVNTDKSEVLQGTLDLMILKTLHALGPLHGFGVARRIEQVSEDVLTLNEGTVYTSLLRLQQQGWIDSEWGTSENNRKARFYSITRRGRKQLAVETENWVRISGVIGRVLRLEEGKQL
jgi:PadR family transcriptional regulator PadR